jgi:hypothetical protein
MYSEEINSGALREISKKSVAIDYLVERIKQELD